MIKLKWLQLCREWQILIHVIVSIHLRVANVAAAPKGNLNFKLAFYERLNEQQQAKEYSMLFSLLLLILMIFYMLNMSI